jgi:hypothetical protein
MSDCRNYPRPEDPNELEIILHYIGFVEFMVAIQPSFNFHTDIAFDGPPELHLQYMQLVETRHRCRNLLQLLDNCYTLYDRTDKDRQSPKSVVQWAREMMAGTATELQHNITLAEKQGRKLFIEGMQRSIMLSNLNRVMETWSGLRMGSHTGWWGSVHWKSQDFLVQYCSKPFGYSDSSLVPRDGWIKGDAIFEGALGVARAVKSKNQGHDEHEEDLEDEEDLDIDAEQEDDDYY